MRSKAPLALMEQLIMVLVFALASVVCLQAFVLSNQISEQNEKESQAFQKVQNTAEILKSTRGDLKEAALQFGGICSGSTWTTQITEPFSYSLTASLQKNHDHPLLGSAIIVAKDDTGNVLARLTVSWQNISKGT